MVDLGMAFGSPQYRCGGRHDVRFPLARLADVRRSRHRSRLPWPMNRPNGWWPDVLPPE
jgi:hypothetical protein